MPASAATAEDVTLRVKVVDTSGNGVGSAEVTVTYDGQSKTRETFSNGETLFDVPEGAEVKVTVEHPFLVRNGPQTLTNVDSDTDTTVTMYQKADAKLVVQDGDGPVQGADVSMTKADAQEAAAEGTTDASGTFTAPELEKGEYTVEITKPGYYDEETTLTLSDSSERTIEVEEGTVNVAFSVVDTHFEDSRPLQASITIKDSTGVIGTFRTDQSGTRGITLDVNTQYTVTIEKEGYDAVTKKLGVIESDKTATYELARIPTLTVEAVNDQVVVGQSVLVSVADEYGEPVEGADLLVDGEAVATTDVNGEGTVTIDSQGAVEIVAAADSLTSERITVEGVTPATATEAGTETTAKTTTQPATDMTTTEQSEEGGSTPGFGIGVAIVGLLGGLVALRRR
jgi:PGF-CTERM protein